MNVHEGYDCHNVDLMAYLSNMDLGSLNNANDIWGAKVGDAQLAIVGHEGEGERRNCVWKKRFAWEKLDHLCGIWLIF